MTAKNLVGIFLLGMATVIASGCSGKNPKSMIAAANDMNVKRLATVYSYYHLKNNFKGPKDEAEFKKFITEQEPERMALAGIDVADVEALFIGERDDLPIKIRYGLNTRVRGPSLPVVFEDTGLDGIRQVGFTNGSMQEVNSELYDQLWRGSKDKEIDDGRQ